VYTRRIARSNLKKYNVQIEQRAYEGIYEEITEGIMEEQEKKSDHPEYKNSKERLYDKLPVTYKQINIFIMLLLALLVIILIRSIGGSK